MKKRIIFICFIFILLTLASCKKCTHCTATYVGVGYNHNQVVYDPGDYCGTSKEITDWKNYVKSSFNSSDYIVTCTDD